MFNPFAPPEPCPHCGGTGNTSEQHQEPCATCHGLGTQNTPTEALAGLTIDATRYLHARDASL